MPPLRRYDTHFPARRFASAADWRRYARWLGTHARVSLGLLPERPRTPLKARVFDRWRGTGYTCAKVCFESMPGFYVTGNLYEPHPRPRRCPGILCPHGHWPDGRLQDRDPRGSVVARCIQLARMGAVVFSHDMVGCNDCRQLVHRADDADPHWGLGRMSLQTWNSVRCLDFLCARDHVDPRRLGCTGASGGGTQTFVLMAVDDRLAAAAPNVMISCHMQGGCICENQPLLRLDATNLELARLFAPKPLFMGSCTGDWTRDTPRVELPAVRDVYRLAGAAAQVHGLHVDDGHNYNCAMREAVYGFFNRHLFGARSARLLKEVAVARPPHRDRMVWWGRPAPRPMPAETLHAIWRTQMEAALRPHLRSADAARKTLAALLPHVLGMTPASAAAPPARPRGITVRRDGAQLVTGRGAGAPDRTKEVPFFSTYNRMPFADRVHEVLAAVEQGGRTCDLVGRDGTGLWCLFAAAVSRRVRSVDVDVRGFDPDSDAAWRRHVDLPSVRQIGGLATVLAMIGGRGLKLRNAGAAVTRLARRYAR